MIKKKNLIFVVVMVLLLIVPSLIKAQNYNETLIALNQSRIDLQELIESGFNVLRINDTLSQAEQLFAAQSALEETGGTPDYSLIIERTEEITELKNQAEEMNDEIKALEARLKDIPPNSEATALFNEAKKEFDDQRYEKISDLIEEAYVKISEQEALQTRFRAIYVASTKTILDFFKKRWKSITVTITLIVVIYLLLRKRVAIYLIDKKINSLNFEKEILGKLIKKSQYEYFHLFKIHEELYHIRIEKFGELIRDIDRQIPILLEEKAKIKGLEKEEEVETKKVKKVDKKLIIVIASLSAFVIAGIILGITLKLISFSKIFEFIRNIGLNIGKGLKFILDNYGAIAFVVAGIIIIGILSAISIFMYIWKRKKEKAEIAIPKKPEKRLEFLQPMKIFLSNKIHRMKIFSKDLMERIKRESEYKKLLKEKEREDLPRKRYLRKQKIILFRRNLLQKIKSIFQSIKFSKKKEEEKEKEL